MLLGGTGVIVTVYPALLNADSTAIGQPPEMYTEIELGKGRF
jgi:hypothetical protein